MLLCISAQCHHISNLKWVMVGVFMLWEFANAKNKAIFFHPETWLLNIYQHSTIVFFKIKESKYSSSVSILKIKLT